MFSDMRYYRLAHKSSSKFFSSTKRELHVGDHYRNEKRELTYFENCMKTQTGF